MGNKKGDNYPFSWNTVRLDLPSGESYTSSDPLVSKVRKDGNVASELFIYVDDVRSLGWCDWDCWNTTRCFASRCNHLGLQDATRKRKGPYQIQGRWEGSTMHTVDGLEGVLYQEKWDKIIRILR